AVAKHAGLPQRARENRGEVVGTADDGALRHETGSVGGPIDAAPAYGGSNRELTRIEVEQVGRKRQRLDRDGDDAIATPRRRVDDHIGAAIDEKLRGRERGETRPAHPNPQRPPHYLALAA